MKTVYRGTIHTVKEKPVRQPDGSIVQFEYIYRLGTVVVLPVDDKGRLWMTREKRYPDRKWHWFLPTGRIEKGMDPKDSAKKELREEIGLGAKRMRLFLNKGRMGSKLIWPLYVYLARGLYPVEKSGGEWDEEIVPKPMRLRDAFVIARSARMKDELLSVLIMTLWYERKKWLS